MNIIIVHHLNLLLKGVVIEFIKSLSLKGIVDIISSDSLFKKVSFLIYNNTSKPLSE